jgi:hypothetical protein
LEIYQKKIPNFVCGSPTSIETLGQDEKNEVRPVGELKKRKCKLRNCMYSGEGARKRKNHI